MEAAIIVLSIACALQAIALSTFIPYLFFKQLRLERLMWLRIGTRVRNVEKDLTQLDDVVTEHLSNFYTKPEGE